MKLAHYLVLASCLACSMGQLQWSKVTYTGATAPSARRDTALQFDSTRAQLILFGGRPGPTNDLWIFNIGTGAWREVTANPSPDVRFSFVSGIKGNYFYIAMGEESGSKFYNDIWRLDLTTETWTQLPGNGDVPETRYGSAGGIFTSSGTKFFVHQGFASKRYFDISTYDINSQTWSKDFCSEGCHPYNPNYPHARCLHAGTPISDHEFVMFGGCLSGGSTGGPCPAGDSWYYNLQTSSYAQIDGCPSPKRYTTMASLPTVNGVRRVVLYGGQDGDSLAQVLSTTPSAADEVAVLDPDSKKWTIRKTTGTDIPSKRASVAMTTGSTGIYMFGGTETETGTTQNDLWLLTGTSATADQATMVDCPSGFVNFILLHGLFMFFGWGILLPWGGIIARYFSSSGVVWFRLHVSFQISGLVLSFIGLAFAVKSVLFGHMKFAHAIIGVLVLVIGVLQPINAFVRPARPEEGQVVPLKRLIWEFIHHFGGRISIALALINISLGVFIAVSHRAVWGVWFAYLCCVIAVCVALEIRKCWLRKQKGGKIIDSDCQGTSKKEQNTYNMTTKSESTQEL